MFPKLAEADGVTGPLLGGDGAAAVNIHAGDRQLRAARQTADSDTEKTRACGRAEGSPDLVEVIYGAVLGSFMGVIGGLSIATAMFPEGTKTRNPQYFQMGLSAGLLTNILSNWSLFAATRLPCGVGGTLLPAIVVINMFAEKNLGPDEPVTVLTCYAIATITLGLVIFGMGSLGIVRPMFKLIPHPVLVGFLTYIGHSMFDEALRVSQGKRWQGKFNADSWSAAFGSHDLAMAWLPGVLAAIAVVMLKRKLLPQDWRVSVLLNSSSRYLVPVASVLMVVIVNLDHENAKAKGWLFDIDTSNSSITDLVTLGMYARRSEIKWSILATPEFATTVLFSTVLGFIAMLEDLCMVYKVNTQVSPLETASVDLDKEVQLQGLQNLATGLLGGLPTNVVGSYSVAVIRTGTKGPIFFGVQAIGSTIIFFFTGDLMQVMPVIVPTFVLFLVGLEMTMWGLWDVRPAALRCAADDGEHAEVFSNQEYALVLAMVTTSCIAIPGDYGWVINLILMMFLGVFFAFGITIFRQSELELLDVCGDVAELRSDVLRTPYDDAVLAQHGAKILVFKVARGVVISFANAGLLEKTLHGKMQDQAKALSEHGAQLAVAIIDVSLVAGTTFDAGQLFLELLNYATAFSLHILVCGGPLTQARKLLSYGVPIRFVNSVSAEWVSSLVAKKRPERCIWCIAAEGSDRLCSLNTLLEICEGHILTHEVPVLARTSSIKNPRSNTAGDEIVAACPNLRGSESMGVLINVHSQLSKCMQSAAEGGLYDVGLLEALDGHLQVRRYGAGTTIYKFDEADVRQNGQSYAKCAGFVDYPTPPLLWLLQGTVDHYWCGAGLGLSPLRCIENAYALADTDGRIGLPLPRIERASAPMGGYALGPLQTHTGFFGMMCHPGKIQASRDSDVVCVVLTRREYDAMRAATPALANILLVYLAKNRRDDVGKTIDSERTPKLLI